MNDRNGDNDRTTGSVQKHREAELADVARETPAPGPVAFTAWKGPLPPPTILKEFSDAVPGAGAAIVEKFRKQSDHRRNMEDRESRANSYMVRAMSTSIAFLPHFSMGTGVAMTALGHLWIGVFLIASPIALHFVDTRRSAARSEEANAQEDSSPPR